MNANLTRRVSRLENEVASIYEILTDHTRRFDKLDRRLDAMDQRLDKMEHRLDKMEHRLDAMDQRLDAMDQRLDAIEARLHDLTQVVGVLQTTLETLVQRLPPA